MFGARLQTWKSGSHFLPAFLVLSREQRRALYAAYAFSRAVDDAVDERRPDGETVGALAGWRQRLEAAYGPGGGDPLTRELAWAVAHYQIPRRYFEDLLKGVELDLVKTRYATFHELESYCYHVAGTVGLICNCIFGAPGKRQEQYAVTLGTAFQLTNIVRDLQKDWGRGRLYIPREDLDRFGMGEEELAGMAAHPARGRLIQFEIDRARSYFRMAMAIIAEQGGRPPLAAEIMTAIYYRLLCEVEARGIGDGGRAIRLSPWVRARLALGVWAKARTKGLIGC